MAGKLPLVLATLSLILAGPAAAARVFIAPLPGDHSTATALSRAVESAVLQRVLEADVVTPAALDAKVEIDLLKACQTGDDTSCVVDFAQSMGVDYVLRPQLASLGDRAILTLSLYDAKSAALVGQAQRDAPKDRPQELLDAVPGLVVEVARAADLAVTVERKKPFPVVAAAGIGAGSLVLLGSAAVHGFAFGFAQPAYDKAELDRNQAAAWETLGPFAVVGPFLGYAAGAALIGVGVFTLAAEEP